MSKHTPGPWEWDGNVCDYDPAQESPWLVSHDDHRVLSGQIQCTSEANARLIAAAPDLLASLKELEPFMHEGAALLRAREAIRKAEGNHV